MKTQIIIPHPITDTPELLTNQLIPVPKTTFFLLNSYKNSPVSFCFLLVTKSLHSQPSCFLLPNKHLLTKFLFWCDLVVEHKAEGIKNSKPNSQNSSTLYSSSFLQLAKNTNHLCDPKDLTVDYYSMTTS